jgi:hypothetical protein
MGYPQSIMFGAKHSTGSFEFEETLTAAADVHGSLVLHAPLLIRRLTFCISTAISDLTASVVRMTKVSRGGVTASVSGNMTIANGTAVQRVVYKDFSPIKVGAGEKLQFEHLTRGDLGGTPAGAGYYGFISELLPELMTNETNAIAG